MIVNSVRALVVNTDYEEEKNPTTLNTVQSMNGNIYFVDDIVSVKVKHKDIPIVGRISDIDKNEITIDYSKKFMMETITVDKLDIQSIKMWECPENVLVRRHIKGV